MKGDEARAGARTLGESEDTGENDASGEDREPGGRVSLVSLINRAFAPYTRWRGDGPPSARASFRELRAHDGHAVHALHFRAPPGVPTVVHFHGAGVTLRDVVPFGEEISRRGLGALLVEYRGYGRSPGTPTEAGLYDDALTALDALESDGVPAERIVLFGISLGAGVAMEMAVRGRAARLILATPFTSIPRLMRHHLPYVPAWRAVSERFDNLRKAVRITLPTLIIHGDADRVVPLAMAHALTGAIRGARLLTVRHAGHSDLFEGGGGGALYDAITAHATGSG